MNNKEKNLVWIDLEFTGLDFQTNQILEIATIITDADLHVLAVGPNLAIQTDKDILDAMDDWNTECHGKSGLTQKCVDSEISMIDAEEQTMEFLNQ